jgi:mevalonate kinase
MIGNRLYPAKLLLFGEHLLLQGASALAIPSPAFGGYWIQYSTGERPLLWQQLKKILPMLAPALPLDLDQMAKDIEDGWYFESNIPQGYGLGSSGALCAGLYDRYAVGKKATDPAELKQILGDIEASFHGKSSGIDPLTAYLQEPIFIQEQTKVVPLPHGYAFPELTIFLIDTQQPRETGILVQWFLEQYNHPAFKKMLQTSVFPAHEAMISTWINGQSDSFFEHLRFISHWQSVHLHPMMPTHTALLEWWLSALNNDTTRLKICGAGGGGFVLGFTKNKAEVVEKAQVIGLPIIFPI